MHIGFITGSLIRIGSGQAEAGPLARALRKQGCVTWGLELSRLRRRQTRIDGLTVWHEPLFPHLLRHPFRAIKAVARRRSSETYRLHQDRLDYYDATVGRALLSLVDRLQLDVVYVFHNTNVARLISGWPHPSRILVINLIGFGIDPSRGGAVDTFPLQRFIFAQPYWDLHVTATRFELEQYQEVYRQLGLDTSRLLHLPHPYDEEFFQPLTLRRDPKPDFTKEGKMLLYPVNVYPRKNIEMAIDVLVLLNNSIDAHLVVTGRIWDRGYYERLLQRARQCSVREKVHFLRGVSWEKMPELYRRADLTIFTSHQETYGLGIVESLGCGTPVVGPKWIIPCREILSGSPGGWVAPKDIEQFAATVLTALRTRHDPLKIAAAARVRYGSSAVASKFLETVREIKAEKERRASTLRTINWKGLYRDAGDLL
jgi:glycosyltransferase involved in cell wall biosynthesis